jgi:hypothetical protein
MVRFLRSDATHLSDKDIQDIINARNTMKRASEAMATKYKISSSRVYQIWRGKHPPIDTRYVSREMIQISDEGTINNRDLDEFYKKEAERDKKNLERYLSIMKKEPIQEEDLPLI